MRSPGSASWRSGAERGERRARDSGPARPGTKPCAGRRFASGVQLLRGRASGRRRPPSRRPSSPSCAARKPICARRPRPIRPISNGPSPARRPGRGWTRRWRSCSAASRSISRRSAYPQRPSIFHFPDLPQRPFYERDAFDWVPALEAATDAIRDEVEALLAEGADFRPYVEQEKNRPQRDFHGLQGDPSWTAFYLWKDGAPVPENQARCPRTAEAIRRVPLSAIG